MARGIKATIAGRLGTMAPKQRGHREETLTSSRVNETAAQLD